MVDLSSIISHSGLFATVPFTYTIQKTSVGRSNFSVTFCRRKISMILGLTWSLSQIGQLGYWCLGVHHIKLNILIGTRIDICSGSFLLMPF